MPLLQDKSPIYLLVSPDIPEAMPPVMRTTMERVSRSLARVASFADLMPVSTQQQRLWSMEKTIPATNPAANTRGF